MTEKILCVDDDANILNAYQRGLRKHFEIDTAVGAEMALAAIDAQRSYAVIVADMRMPGMDGVQLLKEVRRRAPNIVRIMLTGNADQQTAIDAVNEGNIFRFLTKPCPPQDLARALTAGIEQHRLITAEKVLLEKTLGGAIKVLTDVLSLTNPVAFGRASRARKTVRKLCEQLKTEKSWQFEIAAMLSQIGCVTVPPDTLEKVYHGGKLTAEESQMLWTHPEVGRDLVGHIPRLDKVAEIIAYQHKHFDGSGRPSGAPAGKDIPLGARVLNLALDYDTLTGSGLTERDALVKLRERAGWYDPDVPAAMTAGAGLEPPPAVREIRVAELTPQMTLADDVKGWDGTLLVSKGQEVTPSLCLRLQNFVRHKSVREPIRVFVQPEAVSCAVRHPAPV